MVSRPYQMELGKKCTNCKEFKTLDFFHKHPLGKYGKNARCGECANKITYEYRKKNDVSRRFNVRYSFARCNARKRNKSFEITFPEYEYVINKPCFYCDGYFGKVQVCSGLDRIDNDKGYEFFNVLPCCKICNHMRNRHFSVEETRIMAQTIIALREKGEVKLCPI